MHAASKNGYLSDTFRRGLESYRTLEKYKCFKHQVSLPTTECKVPSGGHIHPLGIVHSKHELCCHEVEVWDSFALSVVRMCPLLALLDTWT